MADKSSIEWTDATWNPVTGCSVVSPGCTNCYAMKLAGTRLKNHPSREGLTTMGKAGPVWNGEVRFNGQWLDQPLRWQKPRMVFVCAHGDLFAEGVPDDWIDRILAVMALCPRHTFQVLTKRPARMRKYISDPYTPRRVYDIVCDMVIADEMPVVLRVPGIDDPGIKVKWPRVHLHTWPLPNVLLGVSVEDQTRADQRRPAMHGLADLGWHTWVSYEPALGPVDWTGWQFTGWIVSGGESGEGSRPSDADWHRGARDFCAANDIPYFFKQWGQCLPAGQMQADGRIWQPLCGSTLRATKAFTGRFLDGIEHNDIEGPF